ncbi:diacylglycerol/polyprenol kinase family protein [Cuniculiplasma sp. SKW4]|uniref:diacylglycerol/polyprenol kinase family protein n=1 Tax=Cuniculiplasma sp. SKW4 TaxID=3400171 RepID=UPI003FCF60F2
MSVEFLSTLALNLLYTSRSFTYIGAVTAILFLTVIIHLNTNISSGLALSLGVGISISLLFSNDMRKNEFVNNEARGNSNNIEVRRDLLQILSGIALISSFFIISEVYIKVILVFLVIFAIFLLNFSGIYRESFISKFVMSFERKNVQPGIGSLWYIAGVLLLMGLTGGMGALLVGVFAMAIGDSAATIAGMNLRTLKLPYNPRKSVGGLAAMLFVTSVFAVYFFGIFYIIYAVVASLAESFSGYPVDDNFSIPVSVILTRFILSIFY